MLMLQVLTLYVFLFCSLLCSLQLLLCLLPLLLHKQVIAVCQVLKSVKQHH